jgi:endonuclease/exonuclease/phosphatase family metal-dependent hydrolase
MRFTSFNVGQNDLSHFIPDIAKDEILAKSDVIFLQEIEEYHKLTDVKPLLKDYGFYHFAPSRSLKKGEHGIAILSKVPIYDHEVIELPAFNLLFRSRKRIAVRAFLDLAGERVQVCNVHLDGRLNIADRISQITPFIEQIKKDCNKIILAGDFNTIPLRLYKNVLPIGRGNQGKQFEEYLFGKGFSTFHLQPKYSMRSGKLRWLLDYIYVSNLEIKQYGVRQNIEKSDHHPVWADVE